MAGRSSPPAPDEWENALSNIDITALGAVSTHSAMACVAPEVQNPGPSILSSPTLLSRCNHVSVTIFMSSAGLDRLTVLTLAELVQNWVQENELWLALGLQARFLSLTDEASFTPAVTLKFDLHAREDINSTLQIRDLCPPAAMRTLHVSEIELELCFSRPSGSRSMHLGRHPNEPENLVVDVSASTLGPHPNHQQGVLHRTITSIEATLTKFFNWQPSRGRKISVPRMFRSSRLADLAPGVFLPEYPYLVMPRQKLIPPIARILAAFNKQADGWRQKQHGQSTKSHRSDKTWLEAKLWTTMILALRMPRSTSRRCKQTHFSNMARGDGTSNLGTHGYNLGGPAEETRLVPCEAGSESDWMAPINPPQGDEVLLGSKDGDQRDACSLLRDPLADGTCSTIYRARRPVEDNEARLHFDSHPRDFNVKITKLSKGAATSSHAECLTTHLTQLAGSGIGSLPIADTSTGAALIGQCGLTHKVDSRGMDTNDTSDAVDLDLLIPDQPSGLSRMLPVPFRVDRNPDADQDLLLAGDLSSSGTVQNHFVVSAVPTMSSSPTSHQRLGDVLDGDQYVWKSLDGRRRTVASGEGGDLLAMHDMFENDADTRVLTVKREESYSEDSMLFDSFDFSRKTTRTSPFSSRSSYMGDYSRGLYDEPANGESLTEARSAHSSAPQSPDSSVAVSRMPKAFRRRSSVLSKWTRPPRMSEQDIQFQQSSPTREVDIRSRKTLLDYDPGR